MPCSAPARRPLFDLPAMNNIELANTGYTKCLVEDTINRLKNLDRLLNNDQMKFAADLPSSSAESEGKAIITSFRSEEDDLDELMNVIYKELSEPYSVYTYRFFLQNWPDLCFIVRCKLTGKMIGAIVCKDEVETTNSFYRRGYIAMLAVNEEWRGMGLGTKLVKLAIRACAIRECKEVYLETEVTNKGSLSLYSRIGFCRDDRMHRYYLNGRDAFRLRYFIGEYSEIPMETLPNLNLD